MSIFSRLVAGFVGKAEAKAEAVADKNAIPELEHYIRQAEGEIQKFDQNINEVRGQRKQHEQTVTDLEAKINGYKADAQQFAENGKQELALEVAQEILKLQPQLDTAQSRVEQTKKTEDNLISTVQGLKERIVAMKEEIDSIRSTEQLQKAQAATLNATTGLDSKSKTALDAFERIKARQEKNGHMLDAAQERAAEASAPSGLDARIAAEKAGPSQDAQALLDSLTKKDG
ncbi:hypothetical protein FWP33_07565 [Vibrio parahaemolyticus]|jgi:phage shock protein A|uniref:PspA/IM30 family protein n=2 Tax=Vibrio harveyi group TaxID=717610 RepID=A0A9Q3YKG5_VIBPH|nr:PspA/IM30 family protein [Vibrio parahaemolyticus]ELA8176611.1 PspA/IM30 family protein [Vibrio alginolyticus]CAH1598496.1 putative PspA/IM30 family protein [Vibrio jasicida]EGQ9742377.1 hypothetical protein [Vibrio parahaemolyticus]EJC7176043.1 PspA/IM30 family protein [Vibrio parahaemolyticus]EJE4724481.1 PspA/IM30 family protein [Vibrio parahaemolyticus]